MNRMEPRQSALTEAMRIGGKKIESDGVIPVRYPYTNEIIGTVPAGRAEHARLAFAIAAGYRSKLSRYERQRILFKTGELKYKPEPALEPSRAHGTAVAGLVAAVGDNGIGVSGVAPRARFAGLRLCQLRQLAASGAKQ